MVILAFVFGIKVILGPGAMHVSFQFGPFAIWPIIIIIFFWSNRCIPTRRKTRVKIKVKLGRKLDNLAFVLDEDRSMAFKEGLHLLYEVQHKRPFGNDLCMAVMHEIPTWADFVTTQAFGASTKPNDLTVDYFVSFLRMKN